MAHKLLAPTGHAPLARLDFGRASRVVLWVTAAFTVIVLLLQFRLDAWEMRALRHPVTPEGVLRREAGRFLAVGYTDVAADLAWVSALLYYGGALGRWGSTSYLSAYADNVIALDPYFHRVYEWAGVVTMYKPGLISNADVLASIHYLKLGYERFPGDWEFPFMIGMNYYFELRTDDEAQAERWKEIGAEYLREAALLPGAAHHVMTLSSTLLNRHGERKLAIIHLKEMLAQTEDVRVRRDLVFRLRRLEEADASYEYIRFDAAIRHARLDRFPYLPRELYVFVDPPTATGPRPERRPTVAELWREVNEEKALPADGE